MAAGNHILPDPNALNPNELRALIFSQHEQLFSKDEQLDSRDNEIEQLKLLIAELRRLQFGRKSEKLERQIEQMELRLDELEAKQAAHPKRLPRAASECSKTRATSPAGHLPRETRKYPPKQTACLGCAGELKHLGEDVSEILEYASARFKVIRQVRRKPPCACCERIVQAGAPSRPIERGVAAVCLYLRHRRDLFEEQTGNDCILAAGCVGHTDLYMT